MDGPAGHDISGNPMASGTFPCDGTYEQITVNSYPDAATLREVLNQGAVATSSTSAIVTAQNARRLLSPQLWATARMSTASPRPTSQACSTARYMSRQARCLQDTDQHRGESMNITKITALAGTAAMALAGILGTTAVSAAQAASASRKPDRGGPSTTTRARCWRRTNTAGSISADGPTSGSAIRASSSGTARKPGQRARSGEVIPVCSASATTSRWCSTVYGTTGWRGCPSCGATASTRTGTWCSRITPGSKGALTTSTHAFS